MKTNFSKHGSPPGMLLYKELIDEFKKQADHWMWMIRLNKLLGLDPTVANVKAREYIFRVAVLERAIKEPKRARVFA